MSFVSLCLRRLRFAIAFLISAGALAGGLLAQLHESEIIRPADRLRLPGGRLSHNHSASIVETPRGDLLACWLHGRGEREDNTMVVLGARKKKGSAAWSDPFAMADHPNLPDQNPVLFVDPQRRLWLFRISSLDNEKRGHFLTYALSTEYTGDGGRTWDFSDAIILPNTPVNYNIQPALVRRRDGNLVAFMRSRPVVRRAESADGGMTWKEGPTIKHARFDEAWVMN